MNLLGLLNGQPTVQFKNYHPWELTKWFSDTFSTPLQLEFRYIGTIQVPLIPGMPLPTNKTINQYGWIGSVGQLTHYIIKAEKTIPNVDIYYPTAMGKFDSTSSDFLPITASATSIETVDGQSDVVTCTRTGSHYNTTRELAFRDELSAKADLSALNAVENSLSDYYTKSETSSAAELQTAFNNVSVDLSEYYTKSETSSASEISTALALKQDKLTDI